MKPLRNPQQPLRLDATVPDPALRWHEGATVIYLGRSIPLQLDTVGKEAVFDGDFLHLPLPPEATPRQIQDRAETWLRSEARRLLGDLLAKKLSEALLSGRQSPQLILSFAASGSWITVQDNHALRCNWRLIEQPQSIIEHALDRAVRALPRAEAEPDLFNLLSA